MTFNTTSLSLERLIRDKSLVERPPSGPTTPRRLIVTPHIADLLDGKKLWGVFPDVSADVLIKRYCAGHLVRVSRKLTKARPDVEQIVGHDEVWALCARSPPPGWRILGRFLDAKLFVALRAWDKHQLFGRYAEASQEVITDWGKLFGNQLYRGSSLDDYLGPLLYDLDAPPH